MVKLKRSLVVPLLLVASIMSACSGNKKDADTGYLEATDNSKEPLGEEKDEGADTSKTTENETDSTDESEEKQYIAAVEEDAPKENTYHELLEKALYPLGNTMYIWGGGWNEEDTGAGVEAVSIGVSDRWAEFAKSCDSSYDYNNTRYQIHDGLDCSGYIGWLVYNVFNDEDGKEGYVMSSSKMASAFADYGWGVLTPACDVTDWSAGDIMSMEGHVWMSLGMCSDGSVLLIHASPPGVRICGTLKSDGSSSEAVSIAQRYMSEYYGSWYERYPECSVPASYLTKSSRFRWNQETLWDDRGYLQMTAQEVMSDLFDSIIDY